MHKTKQNKTKQNKTKQNKTKQNKNENEERNTLFYFTRKCIEFAYFSLIILL